jgi:hypothetical protein
MRCSWIDTWVVGDPALLTLSGRRAEWKDRCELSSAQRGMTNRRPRLGSEP